MKDLVQELIPHAPQMGLFVAPDIPDARLENALRDYAPGVEAGDVVALYDATLTGNAKDGAVFAGDRFVFQNTDLEAAQTVHYTDLVGVEAASRWFGLGGKKVEVTVNRGRATFSLTMDFSGQPDAADYVGAFLERAMLEGVDTDRPEGTGSPAGAPGKEPGAPAPETDVDAVRAALDRLREAGKLADADHARLLEALGRPGA
jgi:hypothetical protein